MLEAIGDILIETNTLIFWKEARQNDISTHFINDNNNNNHNNCNKIPDIQISERRCEFNELYQSIQSPSI